MIFATRLRSLIAVIGSGFCISTSPVLGQDLFQPGDHVCLVGNALGERLQKENHFETLLHHRLPKHHLVLRNLCVPGDEPWVRLRSEAFGSPDEHLTRCQADVVLCFFGYNESFALDDLPSDELDAAVSAFQESLQQMVKWMGGQQYNGESPPRVVLMSPIAFEDTGDESLPSADRRNQSLGKMAAAIASVAGQNSATYIDLYHPTLRAFAASDDRLTIDGGHLNHAGYAMLAPILARALSESAEPAAADLTQLRSAVSDKNFHWFNRYRTVNGYSIYGTRGKAGFDGTYRNRDVMNRELEVLDEMTAIRDARIWAIADGESFSEPVDDSGTLPMIQPKTNVGTADDPNAQRGKLGSLEYLTTDEQLQTFELPDGYQVELFASEEMFPELANPVAINFDAKGRLWVSVMPSYPHWQPKTEMNDKVLILDDSDGDGRADHCTTFAEGLHQPTGFELGRGGAFVANQHDILFLADTDGDDHADTRERTLIGFDTADSHHGMAAFEWGPGGGLYFQEGTFKFSQIESPYGLTRLHEGGVWRFDPRNRNLGVHVNFAFANPWGYAFDDFGQDFVGDASPGHAYWVAPISGRIDYPLKHPGGSQHRRVAKDYQYDDENVDIPLLYPKRIRPLAGCLFLKSEHFPENVQNRFLVTNVIGDRAVLTHRIDEQDSGFLGTEEPMLIGGGDGNFRPVDLDIAPDGSLYIIDWHNALIGHLQHNLRDPSRDHVHGRIWRVTHKDRALVDAPVIADLSEDVLVAELLSPRSNNNNRHAYRVRRELAGRDSNAVIAAVSKPDFVSSIGNEHDRLEVLWLYQTHDRVNESLLVELLAAEDHRVRAAAVRVLSYQMERVANPLSLLSSAAGDTHPRVRLEAIRATSHAAGQRWAADQTMALAGVAMSTLDHPMDEYLQYTLNEAMRRFEQVQRDQTVGPGEQFAVSTQVVAQQADPNAATLSIAQQHGDLRSDQTAVRRLPIQLNRSPTVVEYQIGRLSTDDLVQSIDRDDDRANQPLYAAIVRRADAPADIRASSLAALSSITGVDQTSVLLNLLADANANADAKRSLANLLIQMPASDMTAHADRLVKFASGSDRDLAEAAMAALMAGSMSERAWAAAASPKSTLSMLRAIPRLPNADSRNQQRPRVIAELDRSSNPRLISAGLRALGSMSVEMENTFVRAATAFANEETRSASVATLLRVPQDKIAIDRAAELVESVVEAAEATGKPERTGDAFGDLTRLADHLMPQLPIKQTRLYRERLRKIAVRLIRIRTVEEEMRYDIKSFAVEAGRPVQIVLENPDAMPHNLVVTSPGKLKEVAFAGEATGPRGGFQSMPYVPKHPDVIAASGTANVGDRAVMTFDAPTEPGEYPFVCTFPQHWYRMYGVMVVVDDLDAYQANPIEPADPIGNTRSLVQKWTPNDFPASLDESLRGRSAAIGSAIFAEATCLGCHQMGGQGGQVGPALDKIGEKYKGNASDVLLHILEPSKAVEEKYETRQILTADGQILSGFVLRETDNEIELWTSATAKNNTIILQDDIEQMKRTKISPMPKAILDFYTQGEIYELLSYMMTPIAR